MKFGLPISILVHSVLISGGLFFWRGPVTELPDFKILDLNMVTVSDVTNIKPKRKKVTPEPLPEKPKETPKPPEEAPPEKAPEPPKEAPPEPVAEAPAEPPPEPKAEEKKPEPEEKSEHEAETPEPETKIADASEPESETDTDADEHNEPEDEPEPPQEPEEPKEPAFDLDALAQEFESIREENPNANSQKTLSSEQGFIEYAESDRAGAGEGTAETASAADYIRKKMRLCWNVDTGAKDFDQFLTEIQLELDPIGNVVSIEVANNAQILRSLNPSWRVARDNVVIALRQCAPYNKLPQNDYRYWKRMKLNFQSAT